MERYGDIVNHQSFQLAKTQGIEHKALYQEAQIWLWENLALVEKWTRDDPASARNKLSRALKRHVNTCAWAEQKAQAEATLTSPLSSSESGTLLLESLDPSPVAWGSGDEAEICGCPEGMQFRQVMAAIGRLEPDQQALLREVFIDGLSYGEVGRRRGIQLSAVGHRVKRLVAKVRQDVGIHLAEPAPSAPLHSSSEGYGWQH